MGELRERIAAHLAAATGEDVEVTAVAPLAGGACQDNLRVDALIGGQARRLVLRSDTARPLPGSIDRATEAAVIGAAVAAGVRTPAARWVGRDLVRPGATAYFMDWVSGEAIGRKIVRNHELVGARAVLPWQLAGNLAQVHSIGASELGDVLPVPADPVAGALAFVRAMLDEMAPRPALELAVRWLGEHPPESREVTLVHGDFRTGNFLVTPEGLSGILDWEFAHLGCPAEDLAWLCVRDWRFGVLRKPVGGFGERAPFLAAYEAASGRRVGGDLLWWEILGNVRWAAGCVYQGERYLSGESSDLELLAIARRASEMEWEALRLMGVV
ncbi:MAG: acyl-CoA dehydrogenase [Myxococcales bacterium]